MVKRKKGVLIECDATLKEIIVNLDENGALGCKFIMFDLDATHLFIKSHVIEDLKNHVDDLLERITFPANLGNSKK